CPLTPFRSTHTSTTPPYTLSLHDALPIFSPSDNTFIRFNFQKTPSWRNEETCHIRYFHLFITFSTCSIHNAAFIGLGLRTAAERSEEHTSELQSRENLVCRLLLEKKKIPK